MADTARSQEISAEAREDASESDLVEQGCEDGGQQQGDQGDAPERSTNDSSGRPGAGHLTMQAKVCWVCSLLPLIALVYEIFAGCPGLDEAGSETDSEGSCEMVFYAFNAAVLLLICFACCLCRRRRVCCWSRSGEAGGQSSSTSGAQRNVESRRNHPSTKAAAIGFLVLVVLVLVVYALVRQGYPDVDEMCDFGDETCEIAFYVGHVVVLLLICFGCFLCWRRRVGFRSRSADAGAQLPYDDQEPFWNRRGARTGLCGCILLVPFAVLAYYLATEGYPQPEDVCDCYHYDDYGYDDYGYDECDSCYGYYAVHVLVLLLICGCCLCGCRSFHICCWRRATIGTVKLTMKNKPSVTAKYAVQQQEGGKTTVHWQLGEDIAQWFPGKDHGDLDWEDGSTVGGASVVGSKSASQDQSMMSNSNSNSRSNATDMAARSEVVPYGSRVFKSGEAVEYFSNTMGMWIPACVHFPTVVAAAKGGKCVTYTLKMEHTDQMRHGVAMDEMRKPLVKDEPVEVFIDTRGGKEATWVRGHISGETTKAAALFGYGIALEDNSVLDIEPEGNAQPGNEKPSKENVQAVRVRRRFEKHDTVHVYCGFKRGWQPATVVDVDVSVDPKAEEGTTVEGMAVADMQRLDPAMLWSQTLASGLIGVREAAKDHMPSSAARKWMQHGSVINVGDKWTYWRPIRIKLDNELGEVKGDEFVVPTFMVRKKVQIHVRKPEPDSGLITLNVETSDTIDEVKALIKERTAIPEKEQRLLAAEKSMEDGTTLSDYHIQEGSTIQLVEEQASTEVKRSPTTPDEQSLAQGGVHAPDFAESPVTGAGAPGPASPAGTGVSQEAAAQAGEAAGDPPPDA